jgi:hypothetical protein
MDKRLAFAEAPRHMRLMQRKGRPPSWTPEQREQIYALADEGMPKRAIAKGVFGDERYRGRVERTLRERHLARALPSLEEELAASVPRDEVGRGLAALDVSAVRALVERFERSLAESNEVPSLADIERLIRIKRQLDAMERVERHRALIRGRRADSTDSSGE